MSGIQATKVAGYVIMPGIMPRLKAFFTSGFGYIAFLIAQIYGMVRLLPANHAYLNPQNIGKFSVRNVIAQAANNLILKKENIDQIAIFFIILVGLVLLLIQFAMILLTLLFDPAMAGSYPASPYTGITATSTSIFETANPELDIAFMLLDQVFGVGPIGGNQFFNSCIAQGTDCQGTLGATPTPAFTDTTQWPFHMALHELFQFYNTGILVVGALIFLYFVLIVVGETAATGSPFGQRFQNAWVPIRLVVAVGLLIPLNYGFNSGQYITLYAAKAGSSFATNGWIIYNNAIAGHNLGAGGASGTTFDGDRANPTGETESLIGHPKTPDFTPVVEMMSIIHTCAVAQWFQDPDTLHSDPLPPDDGFEIVRPYFIKEVEGWMTSGDTNTHELVEMGTSYDDALLFFHNSDIVIRFGHLVDDEIKPHCGDIRIKVAQVTPPGGVDQGPTAVQRLYFDMIKSSWFLPDTLEMTEYTYRMASLKLSKGDIGHCSTPAIGDTVHSDVGDGSASGIAGGGDEARCGSEPTPEWRETQIAALQGPMDGNLNAIWDAYSSDTTEINMTEDILRRGWAGAGIWYNTISRINGAYLESVRDIPSFDRYPYIMEEVRRIRMQHDTAPGIADIFSPTLPDKTAIRGISPSQEGMAQAMDKAYKYWNLEQKNPTNNDDTLSGSIFEDTMNLIFGTQPLGAMTDENLKTHPLAQLAMLGKGLVDASIRNVAVSSTGGALGGILGAVDRISPQLIQAASSFVLSTAFVGLTAGLVLYYIVPFLPFIYFYFAVASWIKSIFEAMVGVPLWALAHLRLDGEGLPGNSAANGYFLIFEIFLRPILTVFGLIAATLIFTAQVRVLHFLWSIVTENLTGFDQGDPLIGVAGATDPLLSFKRSIIDEFFFSIVYAIIVYMMAIAAFKLIDKIPDNLLRWMGSSVSSFGDINQDSVDGLTRYAALGGATSGQKLAEGVQTLSSQSGTAAGSLFARLRGGV